MNFDEETRLNVLQGFLEERIFRGIDAQSTGYDCSLLLEAMERSSISSVDGDEEEQNAHSGSYNDVRGA